MPTPIEIVNQMRQALAISEPDLDTSVGTPLRKILNVVGEAIAEAYLDRYLLNYTYDIDARVGNDLDAFVALFGFTRLSGRRATGVIVLQRDTPNTASFFIPMNSQVLSITSPTVAVQTVVPAVFPQGATSISIPVQAVTAGSRGNVAANTLIRWSSPIEGVVTVSNPSAMSGGMDSETDEQLRTRFKKTLFRSLAGTEDNYLGVALADANVTAAIVLGPSERWTEQIEMVSGTATSTISNNLATLTVSAATNADPIVITTTTEHRLVPGDIVKIASVGGNTNANSTWRVYATPSSTTFSIAKLDGSGTRAGNSAYTSGGTVTIVTRAKYVYDKSYAFGPNLDGGEILIPNVHYTLDTTTIPPVVTSLDATNCPDGIYDLSLLYVPKESRNDPPVGISNRVDVYVAGTRARTASETAICDGTVLVSATPGGDTGYSKWRRLDGSFPVAGNVFLQLSFAPLIDLPDSITVGNTTLLYGTDYWLLNEIGQNVGAWDSSCGIEISASAIQADEVSITSSTNASPIVVTTTSPHSFEVGQQVKISAHATNTAANGVWTVSAAGASTITLQGSTGNGVGGATGTVSLFTPVSLDYSYNAVPRDVQVSIEDWRMLTTDVVVHQGVPVNIKVYLAVILLPGYSTSAVQTAVDQAVSTYLSGLRFGGILQVSDLLNAIGDVSGIDAVRFLNAGDVTAKAISGATNASPIVLTVPSGHGFEAGDLVQVESVAGNTAANGVWVVEAVGGTTVTLKDSTGNSAYTSGGTITPAEYALVRMEDDGLTPRSLFVSTSTPHRAIDIQAEDNEIFVFHSAVMSVKAANTWGVL